MNLHYTYALILFISLAGPFALSFDSKVAFYKKWKYFFTAMCIPAIFYVAWDIYFTHERVWSFNDAYITGIKLLGLPVEEVLFFFVVPYCCVFIYECIRCYFPLLKNKNIADTFMQILAIVLLIFAVIFHERDYTAWTCMLNAVCIIAIYILKNYFNKFDAVSFITSFLVILIPFLLVNGFLTSLPVVLYNDVENLGVRLFTIPVEDIFYGMLLILLNIVIYEKLQNR